MTPYLEGNLALAYPFVDASTAPAIAAVADAMLASPLPGPYTLDEFNPNYPSAGDPYSGAIITVSNPDGVVLADPTVTSTSIGGGFTAIEAVDASRGSRLRLIVSTAAQSLTALPSPLEFAAAVAVQTTTGVRSLQGLTGDVIVDVPNHSVIEVRGNEVTLGFADPKDRVDCSGVDCIEVRSVGGAIADRWGSLALDATECYALAPHPTEPHRLVLRNFCTPCTDCEDVATIHEKTVQQAEYYYGLSAIHHHQFNRYQDSIAAANAVIAGVQDIADVDISEGTVFLVDRVFNRPYFTQLFLAIVNNTTRPITVELTVGITPTEVQNQLVAQTDSFLVQRTISGGPPFGGFTGFPGSYTIALDPQDSIGLNSESKREIINDDFTTGQWEITAEITFGGSNPPSPQTISRVATPDITLTGAPRTTMP